MEGDGWGDTLTGHADGDGNTSPEKSWGWFNGDMIHSGPRYFEE